MRQHSDTGFLSVPGAQLYYEVAGAGDSLVFIHAGVADSRMWDEQFAVFSQRHRVVRYDTRGFGRSKTEDVEFSNHEDLRDLLDHLEIEKASLVGASRAGGIATNFTLEFPGRVVGLILVGSGLGGLSHQPTDDEKRAFATMEEVWKQKDFPRLAELELQMWVDGPGQATTRVPSALRERARSMILNTYNTHVTEGKPKKFEPPAAKRLGEIQAPTLIILGDLDESGVHVAAEQMERGVAGSKKVVMSGVAHLPSMERPAEFNRVVMEFLEEIS